MGRNKYSKTEIDAIATIAAMTPPTPVASDWKAAMKEWEAWEETQTKHTPHAS